MRVPILILICSVATINAALLSPTQMKELFQQPGKNPSPVSTSCTAVDTTQFQIKLPANQKVFGGYLNVAADSQSVFDIGLAFIFYGCQQAQTLADIPKYPTVIWLNGGPGSSSQYGNFRELGPVRIDQQGKQSLNPKSWDTKYNVVFVDQPIGTGFSQFADVSEIPTDQGQVGQHFLYALRQFLTAKTGCVQQNSELAGLLTSPWFLFGESYAGKYVPAIAQAILNSDAGIPLKAVGFGDGFTDPLTVMTEMPSFAFNLGLIDYQERQSCEKAALQGMLNIKKGYWDKAYNNFYDVLGQITRGSGGVNVYDIFTMGSYNDTPISAYLNTTATKKMFGFNPDYAYDFSSSDVSRALHLDFMQSDCIERLEEVLGKIPVIIYTGQNDLIVPTPATFRWVYKLKHSETEKFQQTDFTPWKLNDNIVGYVKSAGNLELRTINKAGHLVPMDQPDVALDLITSFVEAHKGK